MLNAFPRLQKLRKKEAIILPILFLSFLIEMSAFSQVDIPFKHFYVYKDRSSPENNFFATGWMGDYKYLTLKDDCIRDAKTMDTCIKVIYNPENESGASNWAGVYWQNPRNNWGSEEGAFDLTGASKLTFWARGMQGREIISKFQIGGIAGGFPDSDMKAHYNIKLTKDWKKYTIDLGDVDLSYISGGFCIILSRSDNLKGMTFFIDNIYYE